MLKSGVDASQPPPAPLDRIAGLARDCGLELRAAVPAGPLSAEVLDRLDAWLAAGHAGEMGWLPRSRPALAGLDAWKPWAGSALLFTASYARATGGFRGGGRVARYALGWDYHNALGRRLQRLGRRLRADGLADRFRAAVDAAPVLEREWALRGALGFRGKNTLLIDPVAGPWQFLAELLLDTELPAWGPPAPAASCGSCRRCLDACPTAAFPRPWLLDARRCISYLTIEHRGPIPREVRPALGDWVFGCDLCLESCPFGAREAGGEEVWGTHPALGHSLEDLLEIGEREFEEVFRGSPLRRAGRIGLQRNACIALGNLGRGGEALQRVLARHESALVRGHAAWALGRLGEFGPLRRAQRRESDPEALDEIRTVLEGRQES
ncbi:MAG: tRNA epoxyqueuosine(34) reductase QueG [Planctomycetota bacterium]|nr:MAG: tRNA epoxyqueuosine(34) reductase QueG [Planctomycetota bacterium]